MSYCINPDCPSRWNADDADRCQTCGTDLVIQGRYRVVSPLVPNDPRRPNDLYEVQDTQAISETKVLKVLKWQEPKYLELFEREAFVLQALKHPGIPKGYGLFKFLTAQNEELVCFVMDKIPGQTLEQWLRENRRASEKFVLRCLRQLLAILDYLHHEEYLHRDIKPANMMIKPSGELALIDFGSVQIFGDAKTRVISDGYTAPEQIQGKASIRSDIYALGRTIIHLATGIHPIHLKHKPKSEQLIWHRKSRQLSKVIKQTIDQHMLNPPAGQTYSAKQIIQELKSESLLHKKILSPLGLVSIALTIASVIVVGDVYRSFVNDEYVQRFYEDAQQSLMDGELEKAEEGLRAVIRLNSLRFKQESKHYNDLGLLCSLRYDYGCALGSYEKSIKLATNKDTVLISHYQKGIIFQNMGRFEDALSQYKNAFLSMDKSTVHYMKIVNRYAKLLIWHEQDFDAALEVSAEALEYLEANDIPQKERGLSLITKNMGWALLERGEFDRAQEYLLRAVAANASDATPYCLLAQVNEAQDNETDAQQWWQECKSKPNVYNLPETRTWQQQASRYLRS